MSPSSNRWGFLISYELFIDTNFHPYYNRFTTFYLDVVNVKNKRIFIGWNGLENKEIAHKVSNLLSEKHYSPIVGGDERRSFTVGEEIIQQMNSCDLAIFLIEKEVKKSDDGNIVSMGLNPNVMIELGYMLRKVSDTSRVKRFLINMNPGDLPSDLQGSWAEVIAKEDYDENDIEKREEVLSSVAQKVVNAFLEYLEKEHDLTNKLDFFDNWDEFSQYIYKYDGNSRIADKLIYGMQAAIYSGEFLRLYNKLENIKIELSKKDPFGDYSAVKCAMAILKVFVVTKRFTCPLTEDMFDSICEDLEFEYEKDIQDLDLKKWCQIFRLDKLELSYELVAESVNENLKKEYLYEALRLCHEMLAKLDAQVESCRDDKYYASLYYAFITRNIYLIHEKLAQLEPEKVEEHNEKQREYCGKSLEVRKELYHYYKGDYRGTSVAMDYISQEYLLSLIEQYGFEDSDSQKLKIARTIRTIYNQWKERNEVRNMIFSKVTEKAAFLLEN